MSKLSISQKMALGIVKGLHQELKVVPRVHYDLGLINASRVFVICLRGINPAYLSPISSKVKELSMFAGLDEKQKVRIGWRGRNILIEIPKPGSLWEKVTIENLVERHFVKKGVVATIGIGLENNAMRLDFRQDHMAHVFITGATRSGKTNTERLIAWNLARNALLSEARMIIFDVAKRGYRWKDFSRVANLTHPLIRDLSEADRVLAWASQEISRRGEKEITKPKIFFMIDELKNLIETSNVAGNYLAHIAEMGAEFGLHLILSTQYPQINMLGKAELKRNVTTRLCGRVDDGTSAANALGIAGSGAEALQGYGDFLKYDDDGLNRLTVAKVENYHIDQLPHVETVPRLPLPDDDKVNGGPPPMLPRQPDPVEPEQAALALFRPMGINKLAGELSVGSTKAKRIKEFAESMRTWATGQGYRTADKDGWTEFEFYDPIPH